MSADLKLLPTWTGRQWPEECSAALATMEELRVRVRATPGHTSWCPDGFVSRQHIPGQRIVRRMTERIGASPKERHRCEAASTTLLGALRFDPRKRPKKPQGACRVCGRAVPLHTGRVTCSRRCRSLYLIQQQGIASERLSRWIYAQILNMLGDAPEAVFCARTGLSQTMVSRLLRGKTRYLSERTLRRLARVSGASIPQLRDLLPQRLTKEEWSAQHARALAQPGTSERKKAGRTHSKRMRDPQSPVRVHMQPVWGKAVPAMNRATRADWKDLTWRSRRLPKLWGERQSADYRIAQVVAQQAHSHGGLTPDRVQRLVQRCSRELELPRDEVECLIRRHARRLKVRIRGRPRDIEQIEKFLSYFLTEPQPRPFWDTVASDVYSDARRWRDAVHRWLYIRNTVSLEDLADIASRIAGRRVTPRELLTRITRPSGRPRKVS